MMQTAHKNGGVTSSHNLLTGAWTADVEAVETAIARFSADGLVSNGCQVALFEMAGDNDLHVNVTHQHETAGMRGWAGPGRLPAGFVHNRRFADATASQMIRQIRDMVFAARV